MNNSNVNVATAVVFVLLVLAALASPLLTIAAANTLFGMGIAYSFVNWLATAWLTMLVTYKVGVKK